MWVSQSCSGVQEAAARRYKRPITVRASKAYTSGNQSDPRQAALSRAQFGHAQQLIPATSSVTKQHIQPDDARQPRLHLIKAHQPRHPAALQAPQPGSSAALAGHILVAAADKAARRVRHAQRVGGRQRLRGVEQGSIGYCTGGRICLLAQLLGTRKTTVARTTLLDNISEEVEQNNRSSALPACCSCPAAPAAGGV